MARQLELGARGWGSPARPIAAWGARGAGWGKGAPPRTDLGAGIAVAAAGSPAGPGRQALEWAAAQAAARAGAPRAPPLRRVTFRRQRGLARRGAGPRAGGKQESLGRKRREGRHEGEEGGERRGHRCAQCRGWRREQRRCLPFTPQIAIWRRPAGLELPRKPR